MSDDPRQILAEAGVECAEVDKWFAHHPSIDGPDVFTAIDDAAILALSRLVAKYKWQRDAIMREALEENGFDPDDDTEGVLESELADLERRYQEKESP